MTLNIPPKEKAQQLIQECKDISSSISLTISCELALKIVKEIYEFKQLDDEQITNNHNTNSEILKYYLEVEKYIRMCNYLSKGNE